MYFNNGIKSSISSLLIVILSLPLFFSVINAAERNHINSNNGRNKDSSFQWNTRNKMLHFREDGTFKIVQFTDLHYGSSSHHNEKTQELQRKILDWEKPDLVVVTGDVVSGYEWDRSDHFVEKRWRMFVQPMVERGIRWAFTMGNHDTEADLTARQLAVLDGSFPLSLTRMGVSHLKSVTNYYLPIYKNPSTLINGTEDLLDTVLYFFDSGPENCDGVHGYGCIFEKQVDWYRSTSEGFMHSSSAYSKHPQGLAFLHIPLPEYLDMYNTQQTNGTLDDNGICCIPNENYASLFPAMKEVGNIQGVFCGHDHMNDYIGEYEGIVLAYGRKSGYGSYGPARGALRGARVIQLSTTTSNSKNNTKSTASPPETSKFFRTWIRQEDGTAITSDEQEPHVPTPGVVSYSSCCRAKGFPWTLIQASALVLLIVWLMALSSWYIFRKRRRTRAAMDMKGTINNNEESRSISIYTNYGTQA